MKIAWKEIVLKSDFLAKDMRVFGNLNEKKEKWELSETDFSFEVIYLLVESVDGQTDKKVIKDFVDNLSVKDFNILAEATAEQVQKILQDVKKK